MKTPNEFFQLLQTWLLFALGFLSESRMCPEIASATVIYYEDAVDLDKKKMFNENQQCCSSVFQNARA